MTPRSEPLSVLAFLGDGRVAFAEPLLRFLRATGAFEVAVVTQPEGLERIRRHRVLLAAGDQPLDDGPANAVREFVLGGGGLVALGGTLAAWNRHPALAQLAGWSPAEPGPQTEVVVTVAPASALTDRLGPEFRVKDRVTVSAGAPSGATVLMTAQWRFSDQVMCFVKAAGRGRLLHLGLGHGPDAFAHPTVQGFLHRALLHAGGVDPGPRLGVGLYGYGAIGREHAVSIGRVAGLELVSICDRAPHRRQEAEAEFGVPTHAEAAAMLADPAMSLVVVGTPPNSHSGAVLEAVAAGKHVVCEKPFALRVEEVDRMLDAALEADRMLTVYQSRRWDPDFMALRQAVESGAIGEPFYMESFIGGFSHPCGYWHSHEEISGGTIYDWGSHYFDWVLNLMPGRVRTVSANAHKRVWHDVTNSDQVGVELGFQGGERASFLQSDIAAALKPKWYLLGTAGAVIGDWRLESVTSRAWTGDLVEERLAPAESPALLTVHRPNGNGGSHQERLSLLPREADGFYRNLADHLLWGVPLAVTPQEARRTVAVMEAAAQSIEAGGRRIEVDI